MMLRWDPFRDFDRLTEAAFGEPGGRVDRGIPMDAYRRGDTFFCHFDLPGVDADGVELTVEKNVLTLKAQRQWTRQEGDEIVASERPRGTYSRQLFLGDNLDLGRIEATYDKGVLTLAIPVAEEAKPRKVDITIGEGGQQAITAA